MASSRTGSKAAESRTKNGKREMPVFERMTETTGLNRIKDDFPAGTLVAMEGPEQGAKRACFVPAVDRTKGNAERSMDR